MAKILTKADVYDIASDLIEQNGSTTTVDIKNKLHSCGFVARQYDVATLMIDICDKEKWSLTYNGIHREYTYTPELNKSKYDMSLNTDVTSNLNLLLQQANHPFKQTGKRSLTYNGIQREYTYTPELNKSKYDMSLNTDVISNLNLLLQQANHPFKQTGKIHTMRCGKQIAAYKKIDDVSLNDWRVYSVVSNIEYYFPSKYTRDDVRLAYRAFESLYNVHNIRACRIRK